MDQKIDTPRAQSGTVAVLIPCYNEAVTIGKVVDDFRRVLPEATVYVYDNNSSDGTASIAAEHGAVVRAERRQGKGNVVRQMRATSTPTTTSWWTATTRTPPRPRRSSWRRSWPTRPT